MWEPGLQGYLEALTPPTAQNTPAALEGAQDGTRTRLGMLSGHTAPSLPDAPTTLGPFRCLDSEVLLLFIKQSLCFLTEISLGALGIDSHQPRTYK